MSRAITVLKPLVLVLLLAAVSPAAAQTVISRETDAEKAERMQWWTDARLGMFIHWGLYSLGARHEWLMNIEGMTDAQYRKYFEVFDPDLYDPKQWARAAREAGFKWVVITTKHHDGFSLWDTDYSDFKVTNTPHGKDLLKPFVEAFRAEGLRVGFYYSVIDWHHPHNRVDVLHPQWGNEDYVANNRGRDQNKYIEFVHNQVRELMTDYGEIVELWLDYSYPPGAFGEGSDRSSEHDWAFKSAEDWGSVELVKMVRELQPQIVINDRLDLKDVRGGWDFVTPEQFQPRQWPTENGRRVPWQGVHTIGDSWGYFRGEPGWKSGRQLIKLVVDTVSKGGNLLINVGPTARGVFDRNASDRLRDLGAWMTYNSRAIYGATQAPDAFKAPDNTLLTYNARTNRLYIHVLEWPVLQAFYLDGYGGKVKYAQLLHDASELRIADPYRSPELNEEVADDTIILNLPAQKPDVEIPVIELFLED